MFRSKEALGLPATKQAIPAPQALRLERRRMSSFELQGHRLLLSGAHRFIFQNARIFPVQMVAWGLMLSVSSGCAMKT